MEKGWKGTTGGGRAGRNGLMLLFHIFNIRIIYFFVDLAVPFYMLFSYKNSKAIFQYFNQILGYSKLKSLKKTYQNHKIFGQMLVDRFAVFSGNEKIFNVEITGNDIFLDLLQQKKGFIMASSHVGNFEINGYLLKQNVKPINALVFGGESPDYQEKRNKILERNNIHPILVSEDMSHIFTINNVISDGGIVSMSCDRFMGAGKAVECDFLGKKAKFPAGAFALATQFEVPIMTIFCMREKPCHYHIYVKKIETRKEDTLSKQMKINKLATCFANELEAIVKLYPEQWFNFYDFWKN